MSSQLPSKKKVSKRGSGYPNWAFPSRRAFQRRKRAELRQVRAALQVLQNGIAFVPGYRPNWEKIVTHFKALEEAVRPRNWK